MSESPSVRQPGGAALLDDFHRRTLEVLIRAGIPFLVGGSYAFRCHTGIERTVTDFDLFVRPADIDRAFRVYEENGFRSELTFPHWLGKVYEGDDFVDLIFRSGNGISEVDDAWFEHATPARVFDFDVLLCPPEEILWTKAYIMERERYDGNDVVHLIYACGERFDWDRLVGRFGPHWRLLLSYLILFGFVYPSERWRIPPDLRRKMLDRLEEEEKQITPNGDRICRGTLLSRSQYIVDITRWGFRDARLEHMKAEDIERWTDAADALQRTS